MSDRKFVDTNVLVYLFDADAPEKQARAKQILELDGVGGDLVLSTQVLQEFYVTVTRKLETPVAPREALELTRLLSALYVVQTDTQMILDAIVFSQRHVISLWDGLILQAALQAGCKRLLTEDLQDGWTVQGLRIENPFREIGGPSSGHTAGATG